jgi:hypothetical protein
MFRKAMILFLAGAVLAWMPVSTAGAEDLPGEGKHKPDLWAAGQGFLHLESKGHALLNNDGTGVILIQNAAQTKIKIKGKGKVIPLPKENAVMIIGLKGSLHLTGLKMNLLVISEGMTLETNGKGAVWLKGKGLFKIKGKLPKKWPGKIHKFLF